jgi:catechol 2,3-dioxygenase-like lactoylglutathione lyase family enzyme
MTAGLAYVNLLSADIDRLLGFYQALFGFAEIAEHRAPIHRALHAGGCAIGFNADPAFALLGLERGPDTLRDRVFLTFECDGRDAVDKAVARALAGGASLIKAAGETGYGWYQAVLRDPDGNAFRINHIMPASSVTA